MPYPRYQGSNDYGRGDSRDDRRGGFNQNQSMNVSPWGSNSGLNLNQGFGANRMGSTTGSSPLLPTPGNRGMGQTVDPMALVGNLMGAVGAMTQNNPLATLANQLAIAQAMQNKASNMGGGGGMGVERGGGVDLRRDRSRPREVGRRTRDRSPIARRSSMGSRRSRSRDKRRLVGGQNRGRDRSREKRAEHEIYIGNYPVRFREADVRKLFEDNGITVSTIRLKHDGLKVFAFAETNSLEMIEKAKNAMEGKEINGRKLRVRSSKDKSEREAEQRKKKEAESNRKRPRGTEREVGRDDIKKYLVASFIDFMDREVEAAGEEAPGEYKGLMDAAKKALATAYSLPEDDSFKLNKELEDIFLGSVRREIKLPELPKAEKTEEKEDSSKSNIKVDEDVDDDGNWKRRKVAKDEEDEDDNIGKDEEAEETNNEQVIDENDEEIEDFDDADADTSKLMSPEAENEDGEENMAEDAEAEEAKEAENEDAKVDDKEENTPLEPTQQPKRGRGRGRSRGSRSSRK